jgi:nucleotide-binding universal stress UspA family protein
MSKKILVPLDGSETAETILPLICKLVNEAGNELVLLHVVEYPYDLYPICRDYPSADPGLVETIRKKKWAVVCDWETYLEEVADQLAKLGYKVSTKVCEGPVVQTIIDTAQRLNTDFIAVSTYGSGGYTHRMIGSVANRVLHEAKTPVIAIVHPEQDGLRIEPAMTYRAVLAGQPANPGISS